jgi:hypothetical protein
LSVALNSEPPNKGMKQTSVERIERSQLIPGVGLTVARVTRTRPTMLLEAMEVLGTTSAGELLSTQFCSTAAGHRERGRRTHFAPRLQARQVAVAPMSPKANFRHVLRQCFLS